MPKTWSSPDLCSGSILNEKGRSITKENLPKRTPEKAGDPTEDALLEAHDPDG